MRLPDFLNGDEKIGASASVGILSLPLAHWSKGHWKERAFAARETQNLGLLVPSELEIWQGKFRECLLSTHLVQEKPIFIVCVASPKFSKLNIFSILGTGIYAT